MKKKICYVGVLTKISSQVKVLKATSKVWKNIGETIFSSPTEISSPRTLECRVMHVERVSHDTTLLAMVPKTGPVVVPLGHHVRVHHRENGKITVFIKLYFKVIKYPLVYFYV